MPALSTPCIVPGRARLLTAAGLLLAGTPVFACNVCRPAVQAQVYNRDFPVNLLVMVFPVALILALGLGVLFWDPMVRLVRHGKERTPWKGH